MKKAEIEAKIMEINGDMREIKGKVSLLTKLQLIELTAILGMIAALIA